MTDRFPLERLSGQDNADLLAALAALAERITALETGAPAAGPITRDVSAIEGQVLNLDAPSTGLTVALPEARAGNAGARIDFFQRTAAPVRIQAIRGTVNGQSQLISNAPGYYAAISDGMTGWAIDQSITTAGVVGAPGTPGTIGPGGPGSPGIELAVDDSLPWLFVPPERFEGRISQQFDDTVTGTLDPYLLPRGFQSGDSLVWVITGDVILNRIRTIDNAIPPDGFQLSLSLRDQSGGSAPGFSIRIVDTGAVSVDGSFRTPGQVQGTSPGPDYIMQSEEEGIALVIRQGNWRLTGGTAAQAIAGDFVVPAGNGGTRQGSLATGRVPMPAMMLVYDDGPSWLVGPPGRDGTTGATGPTGPSGSGSSGSADGPGLVLPVDDDGPPWLIGPPGRDGATGSTGPAGVSGAILATSTISLGTDPVLSGTFQITGLSGLTLNTPVSVELAVVSTDPTETEEQLVISGIATSATVITCYWQSVDGTPKSGTRLVQYLIAASASNLTLSEGQFVGLPITHAGPGTNGPAVPMSGANAGENIRFNTDIVLTDSGDMGATRLPLLEPSNQFSFAGTGAVIYHGNTMAGIGGGTAIASEGRIVFGRVATAQVSVTFKHESGTEGSANARFSCPGNVDFTAYPGESFILMRAQFGGTTRTRVMPFAPNPNTSIASYTTLTTVTGATTNIVLAALVVPANTIVPGSCFEVFAAADFVRNAGAGAVNATINLRINGTVQAFYTTALPALPGPASDASIHGFLHFTNVGALGVVRGMVNSFEVAPAGATTQQPGVVINVIDTTAAITIQVECNFSAAVASTAITGLAGLVRRVTQS